MDHKIVFMGKTGAGKTSAINKIFGLYWKTDSDIECTRIIQAAWIRNDRKEFGNRYDSIMVIDTPGIAAALENDAYYMPFYHHALALANCIVWVSQGNTRADSADQIMLQKLKPYIRNGTKFLVCVNHVDKIGEKYSENWDADKNEPKEKMLYSIHIRCGELRSRFAEVSMELEY